MNTVKFKHSGETAVVTLNNKGVITVQRGDRTTDFGEDHDFQGIVESFKAFGWQEVKEDTSVFEPTPAPEAVKPEPRVATIAAYTGGTDKKVVDSAVGQHIPVAVQKEVDEYLELHAEIAELNKKAEKLKKSVRTYMDKNDIKAISGSKGKQVELVPATASNSTSKYSDYIYDQVAEVLQGSLLGDVVEPRVNTEKLESLLKLDKLPKWKVERIKKLKIANPGTARFSVKK